jgi:hypothetical protein
MADQEETPRASLTSTGPPARTMPCRKGLWWTTVRASFGVKRMRISPGFANLTGEQLGKVQDLEEQLNVIILAHEKVPALSDLSREELRALQEMERKMGITLVAYRQE